MNKSIFYLPRILAIIIVAFLAIFVWEVLGSEFNWQNAVGPLLLLLIVLVFAIVAWKWPKVGGWFFVLMGCYYLFLIFQSQWWGGVVIGGLPLLTGILFLVEGFKKK